MKRFLLAVFVVCGLIAGFAPTMAVAQTSDTLITDYDYSRMTFGNSFTNQVVKPVVRKADRAVHAPVASLAELAAIPAEGRYQGMIANYDVSIYTYDDDVCGSGTSPDVVATSDALGCWYKFGGTGAIFSTLGLTTTPGGASYVGVFDAAGYFTGTNIETVLAEIGLELSTTMPVIGTPSDGYFPLITALGTLENSSYQPTDFVLVSTLNGVLAVPVDTKSDTIPADPGIDGYRVFMTDTDTTYDEGKVYTWDDTGNTWDSGTLITNGQIVSVKGSVPDTCVGGATATDYVCLSDKGPSPSCKEITVALGASSGSTAADPDWVGATIQSYVPVSGNDQPVASVSVAGDGAVTLTTAAVETAEAVFRVCTWLE